MNTVITNADYTHPKDLYNRIKAVFHEWDILSLWEQERIQKACENQDTHTRLELAKAVRAMLIKHPFTIGAKDRNEALQAVLKLLEGTK